MSKDTINVPKFQTLYSTFFILNFTSNAVISISNLKLLSGMANSVDPDQIAPNGAV